MKRLTIYILPLLILIISCSFGGDKNKYTLPAGWYRAGSAPKKYYMGVDKGAGKDGGNAATIESAQKRVTDFGTLMQTMSPDKYLGKRIRMTGYMRSKDVPFWAGFWLRVDDKDAGGKYGKSIAFDNMYDRPVKGTTDWRKYEIVLDVDEAADNIAYGALLNGTGQIWFDNIEFEIVDTSVPTTGRDKNRNAQNLDFEN